MNETKMQPLSTARRGSFAGNPARYLAAAYPVRVFAFLMIHIPLALLMYRVSMIATLHALITLAIGLWWAASGRKLERVIYVGAYIVGAEVLWRMTEAQVFWEFGKYATAAIFIVAMLRARRLKGPVLPFLYFVLLLPSVVLTLENMDLGTAREQISFNLSGPFALFVCAWFFSHLRLSAVKLEKLFLMMIGPITGIASIALYSTVTASTTSFGVTRVSELVTSGGFGPNQVSAALGLGILLAFLFMMLGEKNSRSLKILMFSSMIIFAAQAALTFSRGGLYIAAGSVMLGSAYLMRDARSRVNLILLSALLFVIANYIVLPRLDAFTGGALLNRFESLRLAGRDLIAQADLQAWVENPIFGVGPGGSRFYHALLFKTSSAHTELSRLLAEHGVFGIIALLLLFTMGVQNFRRTRTVRDKALIVSMISWSFLHSLIYATRIAAPAFMLGLTFTTLLRSEDLQ